VRSSSDHNDHGFTLVEVLVALTLLAIASVPILWISAGAHRLARSQAEASDLQQRARVVAEKLQRDLAMAGAGPPDGVGVRLSALLAPIVPARVGLRLPDPELSAFSDRLSLMYVPSDGWDCALAAAMSSSSAALSIDPTAAGCSGVGLCGFVDGSRALVIDTRAPGAGYEVFTVTGIAGALEHGVPNPAFSQAYSPPSARVMPIVQRVYYFDPAGRRLMLYDGHQSDMPLLDNVLDVRFAYFADAVPGPGMRPLTIAELSDGPAMGLPPNVFDADLRSIRLVRVTLRLQAAADDVRGAGAWFARPGRSTSAFSLVPDFEVTFDVAPRNMRASP
jgi:prepilin-type N-terminal cleavage/methylation domain-containing protein